MVGGDGERRKGLRDWTCMEGARGERKGEYLVLMAGTEGENYW